MRVATWNINNVVKRLDRLVDWLQRTRPDVVALQELKCPTADFPAAALQAAGYESLVVGQRSWNGVALLARGAAPLTVTTALPGDPTDKEARYVEAAIDGVLFGCLYLPNGNPQPGPKFDHKLRWFERLRRRAAELWASGQPVVLLGDWNVVPTDADLYKPDTWRDNALLQPAPREAFAEILSQGWTDALKAVHPTQTPYTFWDYRRKRWERDAGLRIDHILVAAPLAVVEAGVDRDERARENASDHAPVWAEICPAGKKPRSRSAKTATPDVAAKTVARAAAGKKVAAAAAGKKVAPSGAVKTVAPAAATRKVAPAVAAKTATGVARRAADASAPLPAPSPPLARYHQKRDFAKTAEPAGALAARRDAGLEFVIQKHWASRLHYDVRLELDGVMLSWAVPKGPSFDPAAKQIAIHVEDHPLDYNSFEGTIPKGEYGGGTVIVWDRGTWAPTVDPREGLAQGKLVFKLHGQKLAGLWELVRISKPGEKKQDQWILFKKRGDAWARPLAEYDVITDLPDSVVAQPLGLVEERAPRGARSPSPAPAEADLSNAVDAPLPETLAPQLATLAAAPPPGDGWITENKFDGYRLLARLEGGTARLYTRNGHDWTTKLGSLAAQVEAVGIETAWLDGEIVVFDAAGKPDFNRLQNAIDSAQAEDIVYFVFDLPFLGGADLRRVPLASRRAALREALDGRADDRVRFSEAFDAPPAQLLEAACQLGLEGVMVKRADSAYLAGRSETWLKLKCQQRQEFVVIGFTDRRGSAGEVGGLLLAYHENGRLRSAGSVGTGWSHATGAALHAKLVALQIDTPAVEASTVKPGRWSKRVAGTERWVRPQLVVEVAFTEWTPDGHVRHPTFHGLRADKAASEITRERAEAPSGATAPAGALRPSSAKVTNPDRVIDPSTGLRKVELVRYYESIADWMLPHLAGRPVSLVRAPTGITGELFFQKHPETRMPGLTELDPALWPGHSALLGVDTAEALVAAAQMNTVEFHTWNSTATRIDRPDRAIFDLDPGEGVTWSHLQEAALLTRSMLGDLGLESWLKTSGGKGLHVVVPLAPKFDYDVVKGFSQAVVQHMARVIPQRFVAKSGGGNRIGKIFIDYLRNGHGQTTAAAFSARSRPGLGVSMPVAWDQLASLKSGAQWTIQTAREYLSFRQDDPWAAYWTSKQALAPAMKTLGYTPKATAAPRRRKAG